MAPTLTLEQQARAVDNDYAPLEAAYREATGGELVCEPYASARFSPRLTLSASVVIPAWNARDTLGACLTSIERSTFNREYPGQLEVIVVDDGSTDGTWELLESLRLDLHLIGLQQVHHSRAHTQNTGIAVAQGDVVISCDSDMILAPFAIEELVKRHQVLDRVMLLGFRGDIDPADPRIQPDTLPDHLPTRPPPFARDVRLSYPGGGWPDNMCRDTDHLRRLGGDAREDGSGGARQLVTADGIHWELAGMVYGALFSLRRRDFLLMGGYDERFYGWGCEDTLVGVRALALGNAMVPVYAAAGLHVSHADRSPRKWQEFAANRRVFQAILRAPFAPDGGHGLDAARTRVRRHFEHSPSGRLGSVSERGSPATNGAGHAGVPGAASSERDLLLAALDHDLSDPDRRGKYLHSLGRFDEAADAFAHVDGPAEARAWAIFDRGKALRAVGRAEEAVDLLEDAVTRLPDSAWPPVELALALAGRGCFGRARDMLHHARRIDPTNPTVGFMLQRPPRKHLERAAHYTRQGDHELALRDFEAALILDPEDAVARADRARSLAALGRTDDARSALAGWIDRRGTADVAGGSALLELAAAHQSVGELGAAKLALERARRLRPRDRLPAERLAEVHRLAAIAHPLPDTRSIVERSQTVPGWFGADEAELLVALALRTAGACHGPADRPLRLVEIGSYCGRATVALGLTLRGLGCQQARIISVDEPTLGPAPDGRPSRAVLRQALAHHELGDLVVMAPEDEPEPWTLPCHLLLIDGRHDEAGVRADVEQYAPRLTPGGVLLFHDYADYFPDVQHQADELLLDPTYVFLAHVGSLVALERVE